MKPYYRSPWIHTYHCTAFIFVSNMQLPSKTSILRAQRRDDCFPLCIIPFSCKRFEIITLLQLFFFFFFFVSTLVTKRYGGRDNAAARFGMMDYGELG